MTYSWTLVPPTSTTSHCVFNAVQRNVLNLFTKNMQVFFYTKQILHIKYNEIRYLKILLDYIIVDISIKIVARLTSYNIELVFTHPYVII